jgi:hypothetical protein
MYGTSTSRASEQLATVFPEPYLQGRKGCPVAPGPVACLYPDPDRLRSPADRPGFPSGLHRAVQSWSAHFSVWRWCRLSPSIRHSPSVWPSSGSLSLPRTASTSGATCSAAHRNMHSCSARPALACYSSSWRASSSPTLSLPAAGCCWPGSSPLWPLPGSLLLRRASTACAPEVTFLSPTLVIGINDETRSLVRQLVSWRTSGLDVLGCIDERVPAGTRFEGTLYSLGRHGGNRYAH